MAVDSHDPALGFPQFSDAGAPDLAVDSTAVAAYAADVGNRVVRANLAALDAYPYKRAGLTGHALDTGAEYAHDGSGWQIFGTPREFTVTSFGTNWAATSGYAPVIMREGKKRTLVGAVTRSVGGPLSKLLTVPVEDRPVGYVFLGAGSTSAGVAYQLRISAAGDVDVPYGGGSAAAAYPLTGSWWVA